MNIRLIALAVGLLAACGSAGAAVHFPQDGMVRDDSRAPVIRGAETRHPLRVDKRWVEESSDLGGLWLPSTTAAPVLARYERVLRTAEGNWTWIGKVDTDFGVQSVVITFGRDAVFGTIPQKSGAPLRIETKNGRAWLIEGGEPTKLRAGGLDDALIPPHLNPRSAQAPLVARYPMAGAGTAPLVDVLIVYTPSLVTYYGSDSAALTRIDYLVALSNQAYVDSHAGIQIRAVAKKYLNYTTANDNEVLLTEITSGSTATKTQINAWRAQYGADLVSVLRAFDYATQTSCGIAWLDGYHGQAFDANYGFSVVSDKAIGGGGCGDLAFPHELGHNMGSHHDNVTTSGDYGAYPYSRGHRLTITPSSGFATVMAYAQSPQSWIGLFSNPRISTCMGQPCGIADFADNARSLTDAAAQVAALVATVVPVPGDTILPYAKQDVNANGRSDIWLYNPGLRRLVIWYMNGASRTATSTTTLPVGEGPIAAGDFNGDSRADFVTGNASRQLSLYSSNGVSFSATATPYAYTADYAPLGAADVNGNGRADLLLWNAATRRLVVWYMSGSMRTATSVTVVPASYIFAGSGDINGDGKADLVWTNSSGAILILYSSGVGFTQTTLPYAFGGGYSLTRVADVNGNGKADLVFRNSAAGKIVVWYMVGSTRTATSVADMPSAETFVAVGDYNGDGRSDLLGRLSSGALVLRSSTGTSFSSAAVPYSTGTGYDIVDYR